MYSTISKAPQHIIKVGAYSGRVLFEELQLFKQLNLYNKMLSLPHCYVAPLKPHPSKCSRIVASEGTHFAVIREAISLHVVIGDGAEEGAAGNRSTQQLPETRGTGIQSYLIPIFRMYVQ